MPPHLPLSRLRASMRHVARLTLAALATTLILSGCAQLPTDVVRPESHALASSAGTTLGSLVDQRRTAASTRFQSGFLLLDGAPAAYGSRLALVEGAQKTLDLQYYTIHADASTGRLLAAVRDAAQRGVRVRILLDDFHSTGRNALVMGLAFVPNIEMRMFNPLAGSRESTFSRLFNSLEDASRIQQRMHNKLFIADNVMSVTGGRNLGDAYFGNARSGNFVDVDVLAAGPIVEDLSRSFDNYWNNERSYPVQSLVTRKELEDIRKDEKIPPQALRPTAPSTTAADTGGGKPPTDTPASSDDAAPTPEQRARAWDEKPLDLRTADFVWAPAIVLADKPGKIAAEGESNAAPTGETVVDGMLDLISKAQREVLIISPYFVPGDDMKAAFAEAIGRGVKVSVLTNSLASNDAPIAHVGYARHRNELLKMGVLLYELRSEQATVSSTFGSTGGGAGITGESRSMLHSKVLVIDGRLLVVGSMNLDLRSQLQNTEIAMLIRSERLSQVASRQIDVALREGSWHVELKDGGLVWRAPEGSGLKDSTTEPDASATLRTLLKLFGPLAPDKLL